MYKLAIFFLASILWLVEIKGQEKPDDLPRQTTEKSGCEGTEVELHNVYLKFREDALKNSSLIIIGKAGEGEKQIYNNKRVSTVIGYILERGVEKERIIFATAQSEDKFGYVEIYINGQLSLAMRSLPKKDFCTSCCNPPF